MLIPKVVCANDGYAMIVLKNNYRMEMNSSFGSYYKIAGDLYQCPKCKVKAVTGFAPVPLGEHFQEGYAAIKTDAQGYLDYEE